VRQTRGSFTGNAQYCLFIAFYWLADAFFSPYIVMYLSSRGLSGRLTSLVYSCLFVGAIAGAFVLGLVADKTRRPRATLIVSMLVTAAAIFLTQHSRALFIFALICFAYGFFNQPASDLFDNLIVQNVPDWPRRYNTIRSFGNIGYITGILISGHILDSFGFSAVFSFSIAMALCSAFTCLWMSAGGAKPAAGEKVRVPLRKLFQQKISVYIYSFMFLWGLAEIGTLSYATKYYTDLGFTAGYASTMIAVAIAGQFISYFLLYKNPALLPEPVLGSIGFVLLGLRMLSMALARYLPTAPLALMALIGGMGMPLAFTSMVKLVARNYPQEISNSAQTFKSIAYRGIGGSLGIACFGSLYDVCPPESLMMGATIFTVLCGLATWLIYRAVAARTKEN
jgi:PPP family 3-phenylpropionic acid transporter